MDYFGMLTMLGGLSLFLYGMKAMGDGLTRAASNNMERILECLTSNRLMAVLVGAGVTAVIQSSSATTVMVVGFVDSGVMKLSQAVGVIMGANIGTTITSWLVSLTGLESENFFMQMLSPVVFSPILSAIGVVLILFSKKERANAIGTGLVGFSILMTGMETMGRAVEPLADRPEFGNFLVLFSSPLAGILSGTLLTAVIQSSSASVGILQALCLTGRVSYHTVLPIILGQNIGTCVTALLSSIGTGKNGKRAALIHLYFNLTGTILFMGIFYGINAVLQFSFLNDPADAAGIAFIHTIFNVLSTVVLLPFSDLLERLAFLTVPKQKDIRGNVRILLPRLKEK